MDSLKNTDPNTSKIKDWQHAYELVYYINAAKNKKDLLPLKEKIDSIKNSGYRNAGKESFDLKAGFGMETLRKASMPMLVTIKLYH